MQYFNKSCAGSIIMVIIQCCQYCPSTSQTAASHDRLRSPQVYRSDVVLASVQNHFITLNSSRLQVLRPLLLQCRDGDSPSEAHSVVSAYLAVLVCAERWPRSLFQLTVESTTLAAGLGIRTRITFCLAAWGSVRVFSPTRHDLSSLFPH